MKIVYPKLPESVVVKQKGEKFLFLNPTLPDWLVVNCNAAKILVLCDGSRSIEAIINEVQNEYPDIDDVRKFIQHLIALGFFAEGDKKNIENTQPSNLNSIHLNLTENCNLACCYCYASERNDFGKPLDILEYQHLIDDIKKMTDTATIALTGGEPLLNKDCFDIARYAKECGFYVYLLTNGLLLNESNIKHVLDTCDEVRVSLDARSRDIHDLLRGEGSYDKVMDALELLDKAGVHYKLAMTVNRLNLAEVGKMAKKYGSRLIFQPLFNTGSAKNLDKYSISGTEYYDCLRSVKNVNPISDLSGVVERLRKRGAIRCAMGREEISISPSGDVYPCHMLHLSEFYSGNVRDRSLQEIYMSSEKLRDIRRQSVYTYEGCSECPIRLLCAGGCRARTFYMTGSLIAEDQFCDYELQAFVDGLIDFADFDGKASNCSVCTNCI